MLAVASIVGIALTYVFLLAAGRVLGAEDYGGLAALLGLLAIVLLPASALQMAVSREVAREVASGEPTAAGAFTRAVLRLAALATVPLIAVCLVVSPALAGLLGVPTEAVALTAVGLGGAFVTPVALGAIQGYQRFQALAVMYVLPLALRLVLFAVAIWAGFQLGGAVFATAVAGLAAAAVAVALIRHPLRESAGIARPSVGPFLRYLVPVVVGLIGIAALTNLDVLIVKARFPAAEAGDYAAASAFAKVAFFVPAAILAVLFPRTAARQARGEETEDILGRSLIVTAAFCGGLALFYALAGRGLLVLSYGAEFAEGGSLTPSYAVAMGLYSLANILVGYHLSRGEARFAWIVAGAAPIQLAALTLAPASLQDVVWVNIAVGTALLAAHELFVDSSVPGLIAGARHLRASIDARAGSVAREALVVLVGVTLFVCVLFWPLVIHLGSTVVGPGSDGVAAMWTFWRTQHEGGYHVFGVTHHTLTGAPFGWDEGNGLNLQALLAYYPAYLVAKVVGPVAAYNLVLLSGYVLSGASMYLLTRYLGCTRLVSAWAAMVFVVFPWHLVRTPHGSLTHLEFLPLLLVALAAAARRPTIVRFALIGILTLACWLTAGYIGSMAFVTACVFGIAVALTMPWRRGAIVALGSIGAALAATVFVGLLSVLSGVGRGVGLNRAASDLSIYGIRPVELIVPSTQNLVAGRWLGSFWASRFHGSNPTETTNYLGLLTIALAVGWIVYAIRRRRTLDRNIGIASIGLVATLVAALLLSMPSPIGVFGQLVPTPSRLLWEIVPAIRVPSRWVALAMTALVPLAALGLQTLHRALRQRGRPQLATAAVALAILASFIELAVNPAKPRFRTTTPPEYVALGSTPPGTLAEYPLGFDPDQLFWQRIYDRRFLGGVPEGTPGQADDARRALIDPAAAGTAEELALLGITAIVVHPDALETVHGPVIGPDADLGPGYRLVTRTPEGTSVWRVTALPAPALITFTGGFGNPTWSRKTGVGYPLVSPAGVATLELTARSPEVIRLTFEATPPNRSQTLRLADEKHELSYPLAGPTRVSALVSIPSGRSYIFVKTDPAATSEIDAIILAAARATDASGEPALQAIPISAGPGF